MCGVDERGTTVHPVTLLKYAQRTITEAVEGIPEAEWDTPGVCGFWSVKQVIGHLIGWEHYAEQFLAPFTGVTMPSPHLTDAQSLSEDDYNDKYGTQAASRAPTELMAEYKAVAERIMALAAAIPDETWHRLGTLPWSQNTDLEDFVVYTTYGHKYEHAAQIVAFRDRLRQN
jgi:uncharacterized protein (TIGR03083 family)